MFNPNNPQYGPQQSKPNEACAARINEVALGGHHHYEVDRTAFEKIEKRMPLARDLAITNRDWKRRAVRYLTQECGVRQFLDIGSGIPAETNNVHDIAQAIDPTARVVYVDWKSAPVDLALSLLKDNDHATCIQADLRQPDTILDNPTTTSYLDFTQPVGNLWVSMLHFVGDEDYPHEIVEYYLDHLAAGSYFALTHLSWEHVAKRTLERQATRGRDTYNELVQEKLTVRDFRRIEAFFDGTEIIAPGLVPALDWKPDNPDHTPDPNDQGRTILVGGVGRVK